MEVRILESEQDLFKALRLLYECYVEGQRWTPLQGNPSGFSIQEMHNQKVLIDRFASRSKYLGVFNGDVLVACCRVLLPNKDGLEFDLYHPQAVGKLNLQNYIELNRLSIAPGIESSIALPILIKKAVSFCVDLKFDGILTTMSFPYPGEFAKKIGFAVLPNSEFKYSQIDERPVSVFLLDLTRQENVLKFFNIFDALMVA